MVLSNTLPNTDDSVGITLMKILQVLNSGGISLVGVPSSGASPGAVGQIAVDNAFLYIYTSGGWTHVSLTPVP